MKKLEILCVGKIKERYINDGIDEYLKRLGRYCSVSVREIPDRQDDGRAADEESKELLSAMSGYVILADIGGALFTSEQLADTIDKAYLTSDKVQFVIGGSRGVTDAVRRRADCRVSTGFSKRSTAVSATTCGRVFPESGRRSPACPYCRTTPCAWQTCA